MLSMERNILSTNYVVFKQTARYQNHFTFNEKCFNKIITMNKKNPVNLKPNLKALTPHLFGDYSHSSQNCGYVWNSVIKFPIFYHTGDTLVTIS